MFGYIYETTNLINGKKYIGKRKSKTFLGNGYLGSGTHLHNAIKKYGKENFSVRMLEEIPDFNNNEEGLKFLSDRESYYISNSSFDATKSDNYYNVSYGHESSGWNYNHSGINNPMYGKTHTTNVKSKLSKLCVERFTGSQRSIATKIKMSESAKKVWANRTKDERLKYSERMSQLNKQKIIKDKNYIFGNVSQKELNSRNHKRYIVKIIDLKDNKEYFYRGANVFRKYNTEFSCCFFRTRSFYNGIIINNKQIFNLGLEKDLLNSNDFLNIKDKLIKE